MIRFTQAARRHRIGRASARFVMAHVDPTSTTTLGGASVWLWVGPDERGRELEIVAIDVAPPDSDPYRLVIHVMPTTLRRKNP
jgi:hypothetical protein